MSTVTETIIQKLGGRLGGERAGPALSEEINMPNWYDGLPRWQQLMAQLESKLKLAQQRANWIGKALEEVENELARTRSDSFAC